MDFTHDDVDSLADKLASMDLTDGEWEALRTMAAISAEGMGTDDEVVGFGAHKRPSMDGFGAVSLKLGPPRGFGLPDLRRGVVVSQEHQEI